jgi:hypothetical protein
VNGSMTRPIASASRFAPKVRIAVVLLAAAIAAGCATSSTPPPSTPGSPGASASLGPRPSSNATVRVVQPTSGATVSGPSVHIVIDLQGAKIVSATTTAIRPDEGHLHLYVDNALVSMNYGLEQDIPVHPGTYVLRVEFVAADHAPFSPRVVSPDVFFTVK